MYPRGHRGVAAMLLLLALVLSAMALLPAIAQAQSNQITGLVSDCQTGLPVNAAAVTLNDANGVNAPLTYTTSGAGTYAFTPPPSNYTISVTASGHYASGITTPFRFDGTTTVANKNVCVYPEPTTAKTLKVSVTSSLGIIGGAMVQVYNNSNPTGKVQFVTNGTTNTTTGNVSVTLWTPGVFEVRVYASGYQPYINAGVDMSTTTTLGVVLTAGTRLVGWARDTSGRYVSTGVTGVLFNPTAATTSGTKILTATVTGSFYSFNAPAGTYRMVIGANGYQASEATVILPAGPSTMFQNVTLQLAPQATYLTSVVFGSRDWNNFTVYRNLTLNPDSTLPGLNPVGLRDLRMQINYTLGTGQTTGTGTMSTGDFNAFHQWLLNNGPIYTTTDSFLLANGRAYVSSVSFQVQVSNTLLTPGERVWINETSTYTVKSSAWITYGQTKYYLNMTVFPDMNITVYQNQVYIVQLPQAYEMASDTILPSQTPPAITTSNYTRITVDPGLVAPGVMPQIKMVIQKSLNGTARAKVLSPTGKFYVVDSTFQNYQAYVAENTNLTFSAQESTDPVGDITKANFTWRFESNVTTTQDIGYGITPTFRYASMGEFVVNLTVLQAGGNVTYRNIKLWVDGTLPVADFRTNRTGSGSAKGSAPSINQGVTVRFDGSLSSDLAWNATSGNTNSAKPGVIPNSGYVWTFRDWTPVAGYIVNTVTGRIANFTFAAPGRYFVNLTVTDGVGWKGTNATMNVIVNDTEAPHPSFIILDPANDYAPVTNLVENHTYVFNASRTTDNYDKVSSLTFNWSIPGPLIGKQGTPTPFGGMNITFGWQEWNLSYSVKLSVHDTGFGSGKPNWGNLTQNITVQIDHTLHPDLYIVVGSMKIDNTNPEEGQAITITLNVTNKVGWSTASQVQVAVTGSSGTQTTTLAATASWLDKSGNPQPLGSLSIASGATVALRIQATVVGQGNRTIKVHVWDLKEPSTLDTSENYATMSIAVKQAAWVNYAIIGSVIGVFAVFIFAMYYRRKVKAGDWQPVRLRRGRGEEGGKEKPKKEKEVKEEKKRL